MTLECIELHPSIGEGTNAGLFHVGRPIPIDKRVRDIAPLVGDLGDIPEEGVVYIPYTGCYKSLFCEDDSQDPGLIHIKVDFTIVEEVTASKTGSDNDSSTRSPSRSPDSSPEILRSSAAAADPMPSTLVQSINAPSSNASNESTDARSNAGNHDIPRAGPWNLSEIESPLEGYSPAPYGMYPMWILGKEFSFLYPDPTFGLYEDPLVTLPDLREAFCQHKSSLWLGNFLQSIVNVTLYKGNR